VKEFRKPVYVCRSYDRKSSVLFIETHCMCTLTRKIILTVFVHKMTKALFTMTQKRPLC